MTHKTKVFVSSALGAAVISLTFATLKKTEDHLRSQYNMSSVLVAKKYIPQGKPLTPAMVEELPIPARFIEPTAVTRTDILEGPGKSPLYKARIGVLKGQQITRSMLIEESSILSLAWVLPVEKTAVSLRLEPAAGVAGLILPGDWVDVILVLDAQPGVPEPRADLILSDAQVMAVQDQLWDPSSGLSEKRLGKGLLNDSILVTLSVSANQAARLALATVKGHVVLGLKSALGPGQFSPASVKLSQLKIPSGEE